MIIQVLTIKKLMRVRRLLDLGECEGKEFGRSLKTLNTGAENYYY